MDNRPGILAAVTPHPWSPTGGLEVESARLAFTARDGRPVELFAARCVPPAAAPLPAVLHLPGGTQTVHEADLRWWAQRGFACASFDWWIGDPAHDPDRTSRWPDGVVRASEAAAGADQAVLPLAIEAVGALIDWLAADPRIDRARIGCAGISWGGYLTWAAAAYEPRLRAIVPVYGCGGLFRDHACGPSLGDALRARWAAEWDPQALAPRLRAPACWLTGSDDFFGWLTHGDDLLAALAVPRRRHVLANADHHLADGASALGLAWMRHWLAGGMAPPREPALRGWSVDADTAGLATSATWWTPGGADDLACWWPGRPPAGEPWARAFGEAAYADGVALCTPLARGPGGTGAPLPAEWPDLRAGLDYQWGLCSTQFHRPHLERAPVGGDHRRERWRCRGRPGVIDLVVRCVADPRWNRGLRGVAIGLQAEGLRELTATATVADGARRTTTPVPVRMEDGAAVIDGDLPWPQVGRLQLTARHDGDAFTVGPIVRRT